MTNNSDAMIAAFNKAGLGYEWDYDPDHTVIQKMVQEVWKHSWVECQAHTRNEWHPINELQDYKGLLVFKAVGCVTGKVVHGVGRFKEDGFYFEDGSELSNAYSISHGMPLPKPPEA